MLMPSGGASGTSMICVLTSADVLFSSLDSAIVLSGSTTAVFVTEPITPGDVALMVIVAFEPWLTAPWSHVTVWPDTVQTNRLVPDTDVIATPVGTVSITFTLVAFAVPVLFTVRVYVIGDEIETLVGPVLLIDSSGRFEPPPLLTSVVLVFVVVKFCADFVPVTETVLLRTVPLAEVTRPRIEMVT